MRLSYLAPVLILLTLAAAVPSVTLSCLMLPEVSPCYLPSLEVAAGNNMQPPRIGRLHLPAQYWQWMVVNLTIMDALQLVPVTTAPEYWERMLVDILIIVALQRVLVTTAPETCQQMQLHLIPMVAS